MLRTNLKLAFRNLTKNRGFSAINIFGLAVGMAVAIMIGLWIQDEISFNSYYSNPDQLARIRTHFSQNGKVITAYNCGQPLANAMRTSYGGNFESVALTFMDQQHVFAVDDKNITQRGSYVEPQFLDMIELDITEGNPASVFKDISSVVISQSMAVFFFKDESPIGKTLRKNNEDDYQITGVYQDLPQNSSFAGLNYFIPLADMQRQEWVSGSLNNWGNLSFQTFALLKSDITAATVSQQIESVLDEPWAAHFQPAVFAQPMSEWYLYDTFQSGKQAGGRIDTVRLFGIICLFVLLLACINFINLSTAQSEKRAKEVGVRKTIGSSRNALISQFLTESYLVVGIAAILAISLVQLTLPSFNEIANKTIELPWMTTNFWLAIGIFTLLTGLLAGSYPAFYLSSFRPLQVLKGIFNGNQKTGLSRKVLVVVQFSVSIILVIGTLVVYEQIQHAQDRSLGYNPSNLIQIPIYTQELNDREAANTLRNQLLATGAVTAVSHSNTPITNIWSTQGGFQWEGSDPESPASFAFVTGTPDYGKVADWNVIEGRDFSWESKTDWNAAIINQAAAELMDLDEVLGQKLSNSDNDFRIIGVVEDMLMESPYSPMRPAVYALNYQWRNRILVRLKDNYPAREAIQKIESVLAEIDPAAPFEYNFADEDFNKKFKSEVRIGILARIFAFLAIFISCLGLFGLSAYVAERRTKEIGIRKVLGASVLDLWAMLSKDFILLVVLSCLVAIPIAWYYLSDWLNSYEYRIELHWWMFAGAGFLAVLITLTTVSFQSIKAAVASPIQSLKDE